MLFLDRLPADRVRRLGDGRVTAIAKFARTGCYTYAGAEVGRPDLQTVTVYRDPNEVFSDAAMASFAHKAVTMGHPTAAVDASNWGKVSVGYTEGKVVRDGEHVEIPLILADQSAVQAFDSGAARELSAGYTSELVWEDGTAPDGTRYQARQTNIRGNHIALVPQGRAGTTCRIGDSAPAQGQPMITDAAVTTFRDSPQGREFIAYFRSCNTSSHPSASALTDAAEDAAIRKHLGAKTAQVTDQAHREAEQRMEDALRRDDPNAWRSAR